MLDKSSQVISSGSKNSLCYDSKQDLVQWRPQARGGESQAVLTAVWARLTQPGQGERGWAATSCWGLWYQGYHCRQLQRAQGTGCKMLIPENETWSIQERKTTSESHRQPQPPALKNATLSSQSNMGPKARDSFWPGPDNSPSLKQKV